MKIPETKFTDWSIYTKIGVKGMQAEYWRSLLGAEDATGVVRMRIEAVEDSPTGKRRLHIYTDRAEDAAPARTVDLGDFDRMQDAVIKVVRLGAEEAGHTEKQPMCLYVHYSGTETRHIEEISPQVAESVAVLALSDGDPEFFETLKDIGGKDYDMENVQATPDRPGALPW